MTELETRAAEAWGMIVRPTEPMPAVIALDFVEEKGDAPRTKAAEALYACAAEYLANLFPSNETDTEDYTRQADGICQELWNGCRSLAQRNASALQTETTDLRISRILHPRAVTQRRADCAAQWGVWCVYAKQAIEWCQQIHAALEPAFSTDPEA